MRGHGSNSIAICRGTSICSDRGGSVRSGCRHLVGIDHCITVWSDRGNSVGSGHRNSSRGGVQQSRGAEASRQRNAPAQIGDEDMGSQGDFFNEHGSGSIG